MNINDKLTTTAEDGSIVELTVTDYKKAKCPLKNGEEYWFVTDTGLINNVHWRCSGYHLYRYEMGNVYKTKEEAEHAIEVQKSRVRLQRKADFKSNWKNIVQDKCLVQHHYNWDEFYTSAKLPIEEYEANWKLVLGVE